MNTLSGRWLISVVRAAVRCNVTADDDSDVNFSSVLSVMSSGVATGWTGVDISTPLLLQVAPEIDTDPTSFYRGKE